MASPRSGKRCIIATGFVVDRADEGTIFPSAGGNSGDPRVQAVYWRCIAVMFASARITNPSARLVLFTNADLPVVDDAAIARLLDESGVEVRHLPLTHRVPAGRSQSWGNVLYFLDIMASLDREEAVTPFLLFDSDVVFVRPIDAMVDTLRERGVMAYDVGTGEGSTVNGMPMAAMARAAQALFAAQANSRITHYGGEIFGVILEEWRNIWAERFARIFDGMLGGVEELERASTEEHMFSIAFAAAQPPVAAANPWLRRIWTSPRHNDVRADDEALAVWHVPAEKRYGLRDLFFDLAKGRITPTMPQDAFRELAGRRCGVPQKSAGKIVHDGMRQVAAKLGLHA